MRHASIRALYQYWTVLAAGRVAPDRREIDPSALARQLGDLFILDGELESFAFRLAGSRLVEAMGRDITGTGFLSIFTDGAVRQAHDLLIMAARDGEPVLFGLRDSSKRPGMREPLAKPTRLDARALQQKLSGGVPQLGPNLVSAPDHTTPRERRQPFEGVAELVLLPLTHRGRLGGRLIGALALFQPQVLRPETPIEFDIAGTRMIGRHAMPRAALGLVAGSIADQVVSRRGHLSVLKGGQSEG
jgi:hypothetical protein